MYVCVQSVNSFPHLNLYLLGKAKEVTMLLTIVQNKILTKYGFILISVTF